MDAEFWHEAWTREHPAFDQKRPHRWLAEHWPARDLRTDATVFVPLCGRSIDMVWLAERGHQIIGAELSAKAIEDFFAAVDIEASRTSVDGFEVYRGGPYELWCGDLFAVPASVFATVDAVYDRASMVALPPPMRARYADFFTSVLTPSARWFLVTFSYDQSEMNGPPFSVPLDEVTERLAKHFAIETVMDESIIDAASAFRERGLTAMRESLSLLTPR